MHAALLVQQFRTIIRDVIEITTTPHHRIRLVVLAGNLAYSAGNCAQPGRGEQDRATEPGEGNAPRIGKTGWRPLTASLVADIYSQ